MYSGALPSVDMVSTGKHKMKNIEDKLAAQLAQSLKDRNVRHINPALARLAKKVEAKRTPQAATPAEVDKYTKAESGPLNNILSTLSMEVCNG